MVKCLYRSKWTGILSIIFLLGCENFHLEANSVKIQNDSLSGIVTLQSQQEEICSSGTCQNLRLDLNGDGRADTCIVETSVNRWMSRCSLSVGSGDQFSFTGSVNDINDYGNYSNWISLVADVNGDGQDDLCVHSLSHTGWRLRCAQSRGDRSFTTLPYKTLSKGSYSVGTSVEVVNLNGDRRSDFCLTKRTETSWKIRCATAWGGDEWFTSSEYTADSGDYSNWRPFSLDTNRDNRKDLLCLTSLWTNGLHGRCLRMKSDVSSRKYFLEVYPHQVLDMSGDYRGWEPVVVNIDSDGDEDLCVFRRTNSTLMSRCVEYRPTGLFGETYRIKVSEYGDYRAWDIHVGDINGDGRQDICFSKKASNGIYSRCLRGSGNPGEFVTLAQNYFSVPGGTDNLFWSLVDSTANTQSELCFIDTSGKSSCRVLDRVPVNSIAFCNNIRSNLIGVTSFGAIAGDNTDDSNAFQLAMNCAAKKYGDYNHVSVLIPPGSFVINKPVLFDFEHSNAKEETSFHLMGASRKATYIFSNVAVNRPLITISQGNLSQVMASGLGFITRSESSHSALKFFEKSKNHTRLVLEDLGAHGIEGAGNKPPYQRFEYGIIVNGYRDTYARNLHLYGAYFLGMHDFDTFVGKACLLMRNTKGLLLTDSSCHFSSRGLDIHSTEKNVVVRNNHSFGVKVKTAMSIRAGSGDVIIENTHSNSVLRNVEVHSANIVLIRDNHYLNEDYKTDKCGNSLKTALQYNGNIRVSQANQVFILNNSFTYPKILMDCPSRNIYESQNRRLSPNDQRMTIILSNGTKKSRIEGNIFDEQGHAVWIQRGATQSRIVNNIYLKEVMGGYLYNGLPIFDEGSGTIVNEQFLKPNY